MRQIDEAVVLLADAIGAMGGSLYLDELDHYAPAIGWLLDGRNQSFIGNEINPELRSLL